MLRSSSAVSGWGASWAISPAASVRSPVSSFPASCSPLQSLPFPPLSPSCGQCLSFPTAAAAAAADVANSEAPLRPRRRCRRCASDSPSTGDVGEWRQRRRCGPYQGSVELDCPTAASKAALRSWWGGGEIERRGDVEVGRASSLRRRMEKDGKKSIEGVILTND